MRPVRFAKQELSPMPEMQHAPPVVPALTVFPVQKLARLAKPEQNLPKGLQPVPPALPELREQALVPPVQQEPMPV